MSKQKHSASSTRWLKEHFDDKYVNEAKKKGYRSRAIFKIEEIQNKDKLLKAGMTVVDSWRCTWWMVAICGQSSWRRWACYCM